MENIELYESKVQDEEEVCSWMSVFFVSRMNKIIIE